ncbi:putative nuclease HARBI1 [Prorops nasuta]|uniref:putative nuclease HARBI1 n=1 Tax=Prorops nasuta TaxID=863751 RepID=UPI0034CEFA3C
MYIINNVLLMSDDSTSQSSEDDSADEELQIFLDHSLQNTKQAEIANIAMITVGNESFAKMHGLRNTEKLKLTYNKGFFEKIIPNYTDNQFFSHFRMDKETFMTLEQLLRPQINENKTTPFRKKILLTIWILASPESFRSACDRFGLSKSSGWKHFKDVLSAIKKLMPCFIKWPSYHELIESEQVFLKRCNGFRGVIGAIDGCHVLIKQPPGNANDYYNRKDFHSIVLQGTCDHSGKFIDCLIGRPGRAHDAAIFRSSRIYEKLTNAENPLLPRTLHLLGDSAYPLLINVLTPFRDSGNLAPQQIKYNVKHASIRSVIERAYGLLKGKWRRLKCLDVNSISMANNIVAAACVLHNFLIIYKQIDVLTDPLGNDSDNNETVENNTDYDEYENEEPRRKRDFIMSQL